MQFNDLNLRIVTVHASATVRQLINSELRGRGYQNVLGVAELADAIALLESQTVQWIFTPPSLEGRYNVFQLLRLALEDLAFVDLRISLLLDEAIDPVVLCKALDLGLFTYHASMKTKTEIEREFKTLFDRELQNPGALDLVSAEYLRPLLIQENRFADLVRFEKNLFQLHRGNLDLSFKLAEAQLRAGDRPAAAGILSQIALIDPKLQEAITALWQQFHSEPLELTEEANERSDWIGVNHCIVVDPDPEHRNRMEELLRKLGIPSIETFADSAEALAHLENGARPEIILFEWQSTPLAGPTFCQRVRELVGFAVPLTVVNSALAEADMPLLREMGVTNRIRKPLETQAFFRDFLWIVHQDRTPTEPFIIMQKIKHAMAQDDKETVAKLSKRYMQSDKCNDADKYLLQAELSYFRGQFAASREMALNTLKSGRLNVEVLNTLGKSLMKMRDFETALKCFETAQLISPKHIKRLCSMAESHLELGQLEAFDENLRRAQTMDANAVPVLEVELKGALVKKDTRKAQRLMQSLSSLMTILSFTNNRAISLIRCDRILEGIDLYREALQAVPDDRIEIKGILEYNLALALVRFNRLEEAKHLLGSASIAAIPKVSPKSKSLLARINRALGSGQPIALNFDFSGRHAPSESLGSGESISDYEETMLALTVGPGDFCLHKIWSETRTDGKLKQLMDRPLTVKRRFSRAS